jgi:sn-glycerol 3-phosphate transport system permease protein
VKLKHVASRAAIYLALTLAAIVIVFPAYYVVVGSVMKPEDMFTFPPRLWPASGVDFGNFVKVLTLGDIPIQFVTSLTTSVLITCGQLFSAILAAYAFAFLPMRSRGAWFSIFMATMMIPGEAIVIPNFLNLSSWGLIGHGWGGAVAAMSLPTMATGFATFLMRQSFLQFPGEVREAATLDGAGHARFLWSVLLPMSRPTIAALAIYAFLNAWNMYFWPLLVAREPSQQTIQIGIARFQSVDELNPSTIMAAIVLAVLPVVVLLLVGQKQIVRALTVGAIK